LSEIVLPSTNEIDKGEQVMSSTTHPIVVDWDELDRRLRPNFMEHVTLVRQSLSYAFIREAYGHTMPQASAFAIAMLGCDPKHRYDAWLLDLTAAYRSLDDYGVTGYLDLVERITTRQGVEVLLAETAIPTSQFAGLIHLRRYWVIPQQHPARELIDPEDPVGKEYIRLLKAEGITGSLDVLEHCRIVEVRRLLAARVGIPQDFVDGLVQRADMRRLPYHSRKTISHLIHAGAGSIAVLAASDPQTLLAQVLAYGQSIGKDLHYGVEPMGSALIARVLPPLVE
jgi:hypothetical protein